MPYELYADGALSADRTSFELKLKAGNDVHGKRSAGAPFNVYLRNTSSTAPGDGAGMVVATYVVKPGDTLSEAFPISLFAGGHYSIDVHGPNGFYRSFKGDATAPTLQMRASYERHASGLTGNAQVLLHNSGADSLNVTVQDNAYKTGTVKKSIAPGHELSVVLNLKGSHGWYDFTVNSTSEATARFAGRVETGRASFTDPLMGGVA